MTDIINLGILFGGRSCEHEISVISAKSMLQKINTQRYNIVLIGIDKQGHWQCAPDIESLIDQGQVVSADQASTKTMRVELASYQKGNLVAQQHENPSNDLQKTLAKLDVIFPLLHGPFGEDGCIQGLFEIADIPYVGCGVAASALAMDKALAKQVFKAIGIAQTPYMSLSRYEWDNNDNLLDEIQQQLGQLVFVKPANMGSSVGINKATNATQLHDAIQEAFHYDTKIVVEQALENAREIECAVLGNDAPEASVLGEIIPGAEFYSYHTKYVDDHSKLVIPATLDDDITKKIQTIAVESFKAIDASGLARVDFFVDRTSNEIILNEINTMPGFTPISMYPQLWAESGLEYSSLIDKLIDLAFAKHQSKSSVQHIF